jgi:perosamine synthetase
MIPLSRPSITAAERQAVLDVLDTGQLTHGPKTSEFEASFARYTRVPHAVAVNSCSSALHLVLLAAGIKGKVIVPSFTFVASANAILTAGATPVFADICADTLTLDPAHVESLITPDTEAIMPVHFAGQPCDLASLARIAERHALLLVEDSAQTLGGEFDGRKTGSFGVGCFSFFPTKNVTTGEGGMVTTKDEALARRVRAFAHHGLVQDRPRSWPWERVAEVPGFNFRMSNVLAAIGVEQLKRLDQMNDARRRHAATLSAGLAAVPGLRTPEEAPRTRHVYQTYVIRVDERINRNELVMALRGEGVEASVHFDPPLHVQPLYRAFGRPLPVTEAACREVVSLPNYPGLTDEDCHRVIDAVVACTAAARK